MRETRERHVAFSVSVKVGMAISQACVAGYRCATRCRLCGDQGQQKALLRCQNRHMGALGNIPINCWSVLSLVIPKVVHIEEDVKRLIVPRQLKETILRY